MGRFRKFIRLNKTTVEANHKKENWLFIFQFLNLKSLNNLYLIVYSAGLDIIEIT